MSMEATQPLPDSLVELVAARLRVLGQPLRIRMIRHLAGRSATVQELADALDVVQQNVSQHLSILHQAGILTRCREGARVRYALVDPHILPLFEQAAASIARQAQDLVRRIELDAR
jgi:DNA-binding transcriptional ArsR family regulator